jgi:glyoxylase-like metal-dependent hydrolase (beta-lactamase superfamily II)/8-oxo-dGTP pyrophosphatase MutT (NUDIX family)
LNPITEAASVLLTRGPGSSEVYFVGRSPHLRFLGGFHAFPGGKVHASDARLAAPERGLTPRHVAAVRELFEETGVLLARRADGSWPSSAPPAAARLAVLEERLELADLLAETELHLDASDLLPVGSLVTPPFTSMRFDTSFFVADLPTGQEPDIWPGELVSGLWASADGALLAWDRGELLLSPPTVSIVRTIRGRSVRDLPARFRPVLQSLAEGTLPPIWFSPAVRMVPLFCHGLPPTTHTNAYLVGTGPLYLLDPGPTDPTEQQTLFAILDSLPANGPSLTAIVLTHHHPDHIGAAAACAARYRVPILAHPRTAQVLAGKIRVDRLLEEGDRLDLGTAPHGRGPWFLEALHTPGHAPGHLAFYEPTYQLLFAGDMVSTQSSMIIAPPEGDLVAYLASLERLKTYPVRLLLPSHGSPSARPGAVLDEAIAHRARREEQLLTTLAVQPRTIADLADELYRGLPERLLEMARLQLLAGLQKLQGEGKVERKGEQWRLVDPTLPEKSTTEPEEARP